MHRRTLGCLTVTILMLAMGSAASGELIGLYRMDETSGTIVGEAVNGYDAAISGTPAWVAGQRGGGLEFHGVDWAQAPASTVNLQLTADYTWAFWVKADPTQPMYSCFFTKASVASNPRTIWSLYAGGLPADPGGAYPAGTILVEHGDGTGAGPAWHTGIVLTDIAGAWHHIAVTRKWNAATGHFEMASYLDGVPKATETTGIMDFSPISGNQRFNIGLPRLVSNQFVGILDELSIYNHAMTDADIVNIMQNGPQLPAWTLTPGNQAFAVPDSEPAPGPITYTVGNNRAESHTFTVAEVDVDGNPLDHSWLSLSKNQMVVPSMGQDTTVATINMTGLSPGSYTAYLKFSDDGSPVPQVKTRQIQLTVIGCAWSVTPASGGSWWYNPAQSTGFTDPAVYRITNTGRAGLTYTVAKTGDCSWVTLSKTTGGPLAYQQFDEVTVSINPLGLTPGVHTCQLQFTNTNDCGPLAANRDLSLLIVPSVGGAIAHYRMDELDTITELVDSVGGYNAAVVISRGQPTSIAPAPAPSAYRGVSFRGNPNDCAQTPASTMNLQLTGDYTWAFWAKADAAQQRYADFFSKANVTSNPQTIWQLYSGGLPADPGGAYPAGTILVEHGNGAGGGGIWHTGMVLGDIAGAWHHIAVTRKWNAATGHFDMTSYLDGVQKAAGVLDFSPVSGNQTFNIAFPRKHATGNPGTDRYYSGAMDDLLIYSRALSQSEIQKIMLYGVSGKMWADADEDGDIDQSDFAAFQRCFTGGNPSQGYDPVECSRFDRELDNDVDELDFEAFEHCATGPGIPLDPAHPPPGCTF